MDLEEKIVIGIMVFIGLLMVVLLIASPFVSHIGKTSGTHMGIITAVETNSLIATNMRAYVKTGANTTKEDTYCVQDQAVYDKLEKLSQTGETVTIKFSHPLIEWRWNCSGEEAIITGVMN